MRKITQENLSEFKPHYSPVRERLEATAAEIGVEIPGKNKDYGPSLRRWNKESAVGFSEAELQMLELIYTFEEHNQRFSDDPYLHPKYGGNTAEHPIFMGQAFDSFKEKAGFKPEDFDPEAQGTLWLAQMSQKVHGMIAVHDIGEIADISYAEQHTTGASRKEPHEEALVAPFKMKLAAYALSTGKPEFYTETLHGIKDIALKAKNELYEKAVAGEISGDDFVDGFGAVVGKLLTEAEHRMDADKISPEYAEAKEVLADLYEEGENRTGLAGHFLILTDRYEGKSHHTHFVGKGAKDFAASQPENDPERGMLNRLFGDGQDISFSLTNSPTIIDEINHSYKLYAPAFEAANAEPEAVRDIARKLVGAASGGLVRARIPLLQKSPPFIDFDATKENEPAIKRSTNPEMQSQSFAQRFETQRDLKAQALQKLKSRKGEITEIDGVMDTKAIIAIARKAAQALESCEWIPDQPIFKKGALPDVLKVDKHDLKAASQEYPLDAVRDFKNDRFRGQSVQI